MNAGEYSMAWSMRARPDEENSLYLGIYYYTSINPSIFIPRYAAFPVRENVKPPQKIA